MAYTINDNCTGCGLCESGCIMNAISADGEKFVIDPELCIECSECAHICPNEAAVNE